MADVSNRNYGTVNGAMSADGEATVTVTVSGRAEGDALGAKLDELITLIRTNADAIPEHRHAVADIEDIREYLSGGRPEKGRVRVALDRLVQRVAGVAAVVSAVNDVRQLLGH